MQQWIDRLLTVTVFRPLGLTVVGVIVIGLSRGEIPGTVLVTVTTETFLIVNIHVYINVICLNSYQFPKFRSG